MWCWTSVRGSVLHWDGLRFTVHRSVRSGKYGQKRKRVVDLYTVPSALDWLFLDLVDRAIKTPELRVGSLRTEARRILEGVQQCG